MKHFSFIRHWIPGALAVHLLSASGILGASNTNGPASLDYSSFKIVTDRNIFNARRSPSYRASSEPRSRRRVDSISLVGTMSYEKGPFAFFDGNGSEYKKVLKANDTIAGFKIAAVGPSLVKLTSGGKEIELPVGMQLRREDDGEWRVANRPETVEAPPVRTTSVRNLPTPPKESSSETSAPPSADAVFNDDLPVQFPPGTPVPDAVGETQALPPGAVPQPPAGPGGGETDVLERLRQRAAAERGGQ